MFFAPFAGLFAIFDVSLHTQSTHIVMKRLTLSPTLHVLVLALFLTSCRSHHYVLQSVNPHRIEVTRALDAQPVAAATDFVSPFRASSSATSGRR